MHTPDLGNIPLSFQYWVAWEIFPGKIIHFWWVHSTKTAIWLGIFRSNFSQFCLNDSCSNIAGRQAFVFSDNQIYDLRKCAKTILICVQIYLVSVSSGRVFVMSSRASEARRGTRLSWLKKPQIVIFWFRLTLTIRDIFTETNWVGGQPSVTIDTQDTDSPPCIAVARLDRWQF